MRNVLVAAITVFILLSVISVTQAEMLSAQIKCSGCYNSNGDTFWVSTGETIILVAFSSGGVGNKEYKWTAENGEVVLGSSLKLIFTERVEYTLVVTDDIGHVSKTVKIVPASFESSCLPSFRSVTIYDKYGRSEYSARDIFEVRARLKDVRDCPNYDLYWKADDENIVFTNPNSTKTDVIIGQGVGNGNMTITAVITDGSVVRDEDIVVKIVSNSPPKISVRYDQPFSYTNFNVYFDGSTTGKNRDENNDFIRLVSINFFDESGNLIDNVVKRGYKERKIPYLTVRPNGKGICFFNATITDSHGLTSDINETLEVKKGNTGKDIPVVFVSDDVVYCEIGEKCKIDASETRTRDPDISTFGFYYSNGEEIVNSDGDYCSGPVCEFIPTYPGTHEIKITAKYFGNDNIGSKKITVDVNGNKTKPALISTLTPAPTSTGTSRYRYVPGISQTPTSETPGMGFGSAAIAILIIVIAIRRKIKH